MEKTEKMKEKRAMKGMNGSNKSGTNVIRKKNLCIACQNCHVFWLWPTIPNKYFNNFNFSNFFLSFVSQCFGPSKSSTFCWPTSFTQQH